MRLAMYVLIAQQFMEYVNTAIKVHIKTKEKNNYMNMKKKILITLLSLLILTLVFSAGVATSNNSLINGVWSNLKGEIEVETNQMIDSLDVNLNEIIEDALSGTIESQRNRALTEIEEYYNEQLEEIKSRQEFINLSIEIMHSTTALINEQKDEIDNAFNSLFE